jgi:organic hydroperoxide reductase OsmC/OhrA
MSIAPFPHVYRVRVENGRLTAAPRPLIPVGAPPQFGGSETVWSPEELLGGAAALCFTTTFEAIARGKRLDVLAFRCSAAVTLDRAPAGPAFTSIVLEIELSVPAGAEARAQQILESAKGHCFVANALNCPVELSTKVTSVAVAS